MRVRIDLKIFFFMVIFFITHQIKIYGIIMFFALIHELGHLIVGILLKFKPTKMEIMPYGISISFKVNYNDYNKKIRKGTILSLKRMLIAFAGPFTNLIVIIIFLLFNVNFFGIEREIIIYSNILIGIFNLIPIYPLDGGRILKEVLHINFGLETGERYTNLTSKIVAFIITIMCSFIILYIKNISIFIIIGYIWYLVVKEDIRYCKKEKIRQIYKQISKA